MKTFVIQLLHINSVAKPNLGLYSGVPCSSEFGRWSPPYVDDMIDVLKQLLTGERLGMGWNTELIEGRSGRDRSEFTLVDQEGDVVISFDTLFFIELLEDWSRFYKKYKDSKEELLALKDAFIAAKSFDFTWDFIYYDFKHTFVDKELNLNIEVMIRITPKDLELSVEEFLSIINVG